MRTKIGRVLQIFNVLVVEKFAEDEDVGRFQNLLNQPDGRGTLEKDVLTCFYTKTGFCYLRSVSEEDKRLIGR